MSFAVALGLSIYFASTWQDDFRVYLMGAQDFFTPRLYIHSLRGEFFTYPPFAALAFVPLERTLRSGAAFPRSGGQVGCGKTSMFPMQLFGNRGVSFQFIGGGWLLVLSLILIAATVWLVRRRAA